MIRKRKDLWPMLVERNGEECAKAIVRERNRGATRSIASRGEDSPVLQFLVTKTRGAN